MSTCIIKIIAMISMFGDHLSRAIFGAYQTTILNYLGRFAFLLFCFQLVLGYKKTKSLKKYLLRLLIFAVISQIPYSLFFETIGCSKNLNVVFTLLLGIICISILNFHIDKNKRVSFRDTNYSFFALDSMKSCTLLIGKLFLIITICCIASHAKDIIGYSIEYNYYAILFMLCIYTFYPFENKYNLSKTVLYLISVLLFSYIEAQQWMGMKIGRIPILNNIESLKIYFGIYSSCIIGGIIPLLYNGKKGKSLKWIPYIFYPAHLLFLYILINIKS